MNHYIKPKYWVLFGYNRMIQSLYIACEKLGFNKGRSFPLEWLFQKKDAFRGGWSIFLRNLPDPSKHKGFNFLEEDWDYAIVLDACRFDLFEKVNQIPGVLYRKRSLGSMTNEWVRNAIKSDYKDMVLVTGNPFLSNANMKKKPFFKNVAAWEIGWDDELLVTPPWTMLDLSKKQVRRFPDKRIIFWFMQPHHPFIHSGIDDDWNMVDMMVNKEKGLKSVWTMVKDGDITVDEVWKAYVKNLVLTMPYVEKLVDFLDGNVVITSDHGNCFGEMGLFCHPKNIHIPPLVDVPYFEVDKKE